MKYGAKNAMWAPIKSDASASAQPTYDTVVALPGLNKVDDSINNSSAAGYGDDAKAVEITEFTGGSVTTTHLDFTEAALAAMLDLGTDTNGGLTYKGDCDPPFGGYGFTTSCMTEAKQKYYKVVFYPKIRAQVGNSTYDTKGENITLANEVLAFSMFQAACGAYIVKKNFDTEAAAKAYLEGLFSGSSKFPGFTAGQSQSGN